jgi:hypothetical protein
MVSPAMTAPAAQDHLQRVKAGQVLGGALADRSEGLGDHLSQVLLERTGLGTAVGSLQGHTTN